MSDQTVRVLETITMLFLVMLAGMVMRRRGMLDERTAFKLSRFVAGAAFPALVFTSLLRTVDAASLADSWHLPLLGAAVIFLGLGAGYFLAPLIRGGGASRGSLAFAAGMPNWLFVPLPIAIALYGEAGERAVLLVNVGAMLVFWSAGVWVIHGGRGELGAILRVGLNPGFISTVLGIVVALALPWTRTLERLDGLQAGWHLAALSVVVRAIAFVGSVTVPISMLLTGAMLTGGEGRAMFERRVLAVSTIRLLAVPTVVMALYRLAETLGAASSPADRTTMVIIAAMPVAVTCSVVAEKYGGDVPLVTRSIFVSTVASVATVPLMVWLLGVIGL